MPRLSFFAICFGLFAVAAQADIIYVSGDVCGVWSADTVMVMGEVRVPAGQALTVQPGVRVLFTGLYKFIVNGLLTASGISTDSIIFTRAYPTEESKWRGFRFDTADDASILEYCCVEYARGEGAYPDVHGGAIWIMNCSPAIRHCLIANNYSHNANYNGMGAGICAEENCTSVIEYSRIVQNVADSGGGICAAWASNPIIRYNLIEYNQAYSAGGGIYVSANAQATVYGNTIRFNNSSGWGGGGVNLWGATWLYGTFTTLYDNLIISNSATDAGGGIYTRYETSRIYNNTLVNNVAYRGGGIYVITFSYLPPVVNNSIVWGNDAPTGPEMYLEASVGSTATVTYSDVQGGWTGIGNLNQNPVFVNSMWSDYRLQWGSPCIDSGDPNPVYNDPDGTRADMGAFYFDQSMPVRILLTAHGAPIRIPAGGGSFDYNIQACNIDSLAHQILIWCDADLPNGTQRGPLYGPLTITLGPDSIVSKVRTQTVPGAAPAGNYLYNAYAVVGQDTSKDSFAFEKLGDSGQVREDPYVAGMTWSGGWQNTGEPITDVEATQASPLQGQGEARLAPTPFALYPCSPNPFNSSTVLSYELSDASLVDLSIYDVTGRVTRSIVKGWRDVGGHEVIFDGSRLPSGIYICRLQAGDFEVVQKLVLLK